MKMLRKITDAFTFELEWVERVQLQEVLRCFPLTPLAHYRIAREADPGQRSGAQPLLEEAMAAHQQTLRQHVQDLLVSGRRFTGDGDKYLLTLQGEEIEWLLQALNDVRIGCWIQMGSPAEGRPRAMDKIQAGYYLLMETALMFEDVLLHALDERSWGTAPAEPTDPEP